MLNLTRELACAGVKRNKIEFLVRAVSSIKIESEANKLRIHDPKATSQLIHEKSQNIKNVQTTGEREQCEKDYVLFHDFRDKGLITLNRPKSLNVLSTSMCQKIFTALKKWESSKKLILMKANGDRAFCSGGDLNIMRDSPPGNATPAIVFFQALFRLYHLLYTYKLPIVVFMNNITMGGGSGISIHNKYKIVTERSVFAMPETAIGFFPDAGCTYLLPRLRGQLGVFLGLTGYRLKGTDITHAGIATHYVLAEKLKDLEKELLLSDSRNVGEIFDSYRANTDGLEFSLAPYMDKIDACFSADSVEEIIERLQNDGSKWSKMVTKTIEKMSPSSLKLTHRALREGKKLTFNDCIKMEYRLAYSLVSTDSDFHKGYGSIINKSQAPNWQPKSLKDVKLEDVLKRFVLPSPELELKLED